MSEEERTWDLGPSFSSLEHGFFMLRKKNAEMGQTLADAKVWDLLFQVLDIYFVQNEAISCK